MSQRLRFPVLFVTLLGLAALSSFVVARPAAAQVAPISWQVRSYALNVRVLPPLVADYQLGTATLESDGTLDETTSSATGSVVDRDKPLPRLARKYSPSTLRLRVLSGSYSEPDGARRLDLRVMITSSSPSRARQCLVGSTALLTLIDYDWPEWQLDNGESADFVGLGSFSSSCGHVHGWSNEDREGTEPTFGGSGGGNQADVRIVGPQTSATPTTTATTPPTAPPTTARTSTAPPTIAPGTGPCAGFTGTFTSTYNEMRLSNGVGVYAYKDGQVSGTVTRTATGWKLVGRWVQSNAAGPVTFELDSAGNLSGQWTYDNAAGGGGWSGKCVSG